MATYTGTADASGNWSIPVTTPLALGERSVRARQALNGVDFGALSSSFAMQVAVASPLTGTVSALHLDAAGGMWFRDGAWADQADTIDFARGSAATYFDAAGDLQSAADNVLRVDYGAGGGTAVGALLEGARTNRLINTSTFSSGWSGNGSTRTVIDDGAFDGNADALRVDILSNTGLNTFQQIGSFTIGQVVRASAWVKGAVGEQIYFLSDDKDGAQVLVTFTGEWQFISTPAYALTVTDVYFGFEIYNRAGGAALPTGITFDICYPQYEVAAFPSSYIESGGTAATRAADVLSIGPVGGLPFEGYDAAEISGVVAFRTAPGQSGNQVLWQIDDGSEDDRLRIVRDASGDLRFIVTVGGVEQCNLDLGAVADSTDGRIAFRAAAGSFAASLDGGAAVTDGAGTMPTVTTTRIGNSYAGEEWFGHVASATLYAAALADAELVEMAS